MRLPQVAPTLASALFAVFAAVALAAACLPCGRALAAECAPDGGAGVAGTASAAADGADAAYSEGADAALASASVERIAGDDRYGTAAEVAARFGETGGTVVLATGANYPDALCASALAGCFGSPVLITDPGSLPQPTAGQLARLAPSKVLIVGGESAVGASVERAVRESYCADVERIAGADRYGTCAAVAARVASASAAAGRASGACVIATGANFADALSASPYAYATCSPVLLCDGGALPGELAAAAQGYGAAVIAGGTSAVPDSVREQLPGASVTRLAGADRYETSAKIAQWASENGLSGTEPAVATGADFPDALCGGALCGAAASPLLLVGSGSGDVVDAAAYLCGARDGVQSVRILGGVSAVSEETGSYLLASASGSDASVNYLSGTIRIMTPYELLDATGYCAVLGKGVDEVYARLEREQGRSDGLSYAVLCLDSATPVTAHRGDGQGMATRDMELVVLGRSAYTWSSAYGTRDYAVSPFYGKACSHAGERVSLAIPGDALWYSSQEWYGMQVPSVAVY